MKTDLIFKNDVLATIIGYFGNIEVPYSVNDDAESIKSVVKRSRVSAEPLKVLSALNLKVETLTIVSVDQDIDDISQMIKNRALFIVPSSYKRVLILSACSDCPFFDPDPNDVDTDPSLYGKNYCHKMKKELINDVDISIPDECPLEIKN